MQLLRQLKKKPFCNNFHLIFIGTILFIISCKYWYICIIFIAYLLYIIKKTRLLIPILIINIFMLIGINILKYKETQKYDKIEGKIINVIDDDSYILKYNQTKFLVYDKEHLNEPGDIITGEIVIYEEQEKSYVFDFDYQNYLRQNGIAHRCKINNKEFVKKGFTINIIKYNYLKYLKQNLTPDSFQYVSALVFADKIFEEDISDSYNSLGISHILAISGLHILFLYKILTLILLKLFKYYKNIIPLTIITIYVILIGCPISCFRALLLLIISSINKKGTIKYTKLDILSISGIIILLINPYQLFSISFILSFLACFILIFANELIVKKNKIIYYYKIYFLINLLLLPILINMNNEINILSFLFAPILSNLIIYLILPITYLISIFPILDFVFKYLYIFLNYYIYNLANVISPLHIESMNILFIIIYYLFYVFIILKLAKDKKIIINIIYLCMFFIFFLTYKNIIIYSKISFLDCGQGDCSVIKLPNNRGTMVIDAYNSYEYLKKTGVYEIDYLVLTHSDADHIGDYQEIIKYFNVKKIIFPKFDVRLNELLYEYNNTYAISDVDSFSFGNTDIRILGPINQYDDSNSNSIVLRIKIEEFVFLYTGDMTSDEEKDIIIKYGDLLKCNVLKVSHHGSKTSTSDEFLNYCKPDYSIISVSNNNKYGLPDDTIVKKLNEISILYQTKDVGNIDFIIYKENLYVKKYR